MRCITRRTEYESRGDTFRLVLLADTHLGNLNTDERLLKNIVRDIEGDERAYWGHLGDMCEYINMRDPRFDPDSLPGWLLGREALRDIARTETAHFIDIMKPIADKCVFLCEGNHEEAILSHSEADVYSAIIEAMASKDEHRLGHRGFVNWQFTAFRKTWTLRLFLTHGSGGGQAGGTAGSKLAKLASQVDGVDILAMGHIHQYDHKAIVKYRPGRTHEAERVTIHALSCPPMVADMQYADRKDYGGTSVGYVQLLIRPFAHEIKVETFVS
jgi:hypothetical protein